MTKQTFRLVHPAARHNAIEAVRRAEAGHVVVIQPATRSLEQNAMLHAALSDIAEQVRWHGVRFDVDTWKRLCAAACLREQGEQPELIPALDGKGFDIVYEKTSQMTKEQMTALLEWVLMFGAQNGCVFRDKPVRDEDVDAFAK